MSPHLRHALALLMGFMGLVTLTCATPSLAPAQTTTFYLSHPDCRFWKPHVDNPFDYTHEYSQPAIAWDAEYAAVSLGTGIVLKKLGAPLWVAGVVPTIGLGLVPHLVGWRLGKYNVDLGHWAFVAWNRSGPAFWAYAARDDSAHVHWTNHARAAGLWLAGDFALTCFDR